MAKRLRPDLKEVTGKPETAEFPIEWLSLAARLPGRTLHVGLLLWRLGAFGDCDGVAITNGISSTFGLDRNAKYRGLANLEKAGLIKVVRKLGRSPVVTIVDPSGR
jgi:hypothetical protein